MKNDKDPRYYPLLRGSMNPLGLIDTDPQGSYTGIPADPLEQPVQDADDL